MEYDLQKRPKKQKAKRIRLRKPSARLKAELQSNKHQLWRRKRSKQQGGLCYYCAIEMTEKGPKENERKSNVTLDHFLPTHLSGEDHWENVVACCRSCNFKKGHLHPRDFPAHPTFQLDYEKRLWSYLYDHSDDDNGDEDNGVEIYQTENVEHDVIGSTDSNMILSSAKY